MWLIFYRDRTLKSQDSVTQSKREVTAYEGEDVSIFWYIKSTNDYPEYVLRKDVIGPGDIDDRFKGRFDAHLNSITKSVPLMIQRVHLSDFAVYYCALKPTVTTGCTVQPAYKNYLIVKNTLDLVKDNTKKKPCVVLYFFVQSSLKCKSYLLLVTYNLMLIALAYISSTIPWGIHRSCRG
uniref:Immunoglobulin V-set domain-containing protein n=1 Tax=Hucho hucho TaxID=62062 RepID=A0A4W5KJZ0_9TELE